MARSRTIKFGFFKNEDIAECSPYARLMFIGLWCLADREGRLEDRPKKLRAEILPYDQCDGDELLNELSGYEFIKRYEVDGDRYIQIINFDKHQNPHKNETHSLYPPPYGSYLDKHGLNQELSTSTPENDESSMEENDSTIDEIATVPVVYPTTPEFIGNVHDSSGTLPDMHSTNPAYHLSPYHLSLDQKHILVESAAEGSVPEKVSTDRDRTPYAQIAAQYNKLCIMLPQIQKVTPARRKAMKAFYQEMGSAMDAVNAYFIKATKCPYLIGEGPNGWRASVDWLLELDNVTKVLEGNYDKLQDPKPSGSKSGAPQSAKPNRFNDFKLNKQYSDEELERKLGLKGSQ